MERAAEVRAQIGIVHELRNITAAIRSLAAQRLQQASTELDGLRSYTDVIDTALASLGPDGERSTERAPTRPCVVVFASEFGFVRGFNERLFRALTPRDAPLLVVGSRGASLFGERGVAVAWHLPMATHTRAVGHTVIDLMEELSRRLESAQIDAVDVMFASARSSGPSGVVRERVVPFAFPATERRSEPIVTHLSAGLLRRRLAEESVFARLTRAAIESLASENLARLRAMEAAREHLDERLAGLTSLSQELRQEEITTEILDLVTGAWAVEPRRSPTGPAMRKSMTGL